jgi:hypothetical protein
VICTKRRLNFVRSRGATFPLSSVPIWRYGITFTWPSLDVPPFFLFEEDEVCWSGEMNVPLISRDIKPFPFFALTKWILGLIVNRARLQAVRLDLCRVL